LGKKKSSPSNRSWWSKSLWLVTKMSTFSLLYRLDHALVVGSSDLCRHEGSGVGRGWCYCGRDVHRRKPERCSLNAETSILDLHAQRRAEVQRLRNRTSRGEERDLGGTRENAQLVVVSVRYDRRQRLRSPWRRSGTRSCHERCGSAQRRP